MRPPISFSSILSFDGHISWFTWILVPFLGISLLACEPAPSTEAGPASNEPPAPTSGSELPVAPDFLTANLWNDGQAEVAFYQIERTQNQYGQAADRGSSELGGSIGFAY